MKKFFHWIVAIDVVSVLAAFLKVAGAASVGVLISFETLHAFKKSISKVVMVIINFVFIVFVIESFDSIIKRTGLINTVIRN